MHSGHCPCPQSLVLQGEPRPAVWVCGNGTRPALPWEGHLPGGRQLLPAHNPVPWPRNLGVLCAITKHTSAWFPAHPCPASLSQVTHGWLGLCPPWESPHPIPTPTPAPCSARVLVASPEAWPCPARAGFLPSLNRRPPSSGGAALGQGLQSFGGAHRQQSSRMHNPFQLPSGPVCPGS